MTADNPPLPAGYVDELGAVARDAYRDIIRRNVAGPFIDEVGSYAWVGGSSHADAVDEARQAIRAHPRDEQGRLIAEPLPPPRVVNRFAACGRLYLDALDLVDYEPSGYDLVHMGLVDAQRQMLADVDERLRQLVAAGIPRERLRIVDERLEPQYDGDGATFTLSWAMRIELVDPEETSPPHPTEAP
jgi:hypothetical protein